MADHLEETDRTKLRDIWFEYRNEVDKFLFAGGAAGTGFCLHQLFNKDTTTCEGIFLLMSAIFFGLVSAVVVIIFKLNADLIRRFMETPGASNSSIVLKILDWLAIIFFVLAVFALLLSSFVHLSLK